MRRLALALALAAVVLGGVVLINPPYRAFRLTSRILDDERIPDGGHVPGPGLERGLPFIFAGSEDRPFAAGLSLTRGPLPP